VAVSVLTGPVLAGDDDAYRSAQLPRQYWKVAMVKRSGELSVTGYLLSQAALLDKLESTREFSYGAYWTFQVPVRRIALTGLGLDQHVAADPLERPEATPLPRELIRREDLLLYSFPAGDDRVGHARRAVAAPRRRAARARVSRVPGTSGCTAAATCR